MTELVSTLFVMLNVATSSAVPRVSLTKTTPIFFDKDSSIFNNYPSEIF